MAGYLSGAGAAGATRATSSPSCAAAAAPRSGGSSAGTDPDPLRCSRRYRPPDCSGRRIWDAAHDARRSPVAAYLAGRDITILPPPTLRWAPACRHPNGIHLPAMVAKVVNVDGKLIAVHRTFLRPDGSGKANIEPDRAALAPTGGGAVRLAPAAARLTVDEGIETCLSVMQATGETFWAALSTQG